jgi:hypothetical protein
MAAGRRVRANIVATESTGLKSKLSMHPPPLLLRAAGLAAAWGYTAAFLGVAVIGIAGLFLTFQSSVSRADRRQKAVAEIVWVGWPRTRSTGGFW